MLITSLGGVLVNLIHFLKKCDETKTIVLGLDWNQEALLKKKFLPENPDIFPRFHWKKRSGF